MQIPVENIYFLLCYAWDKLEEKDRVNVSTDGRHDLLELLSQVLINGSRILLKRGLEHDYVSHTQESVGVKGKLEVSKSVKQNSFQRLHAVCNYDEYSADILHNQILITTLFQLLYAVRLDDDLKHDIRRILRRFPRIQIIDLNPVVFDKIKIHRNNRFYEFLLNVCQLIYENQLPNEDEGTWAFSDVTRDEDKMAILFEKFVLNYYKREYSEWDVRGEYIYWNFDVDDDKNLEYLPRMETDITLRKPHEKIIIDTKYYKDTMQRNYDTDKIKSGNLYQLFSYLMHQQDGTERNFRTKGILLYPTISEEYDLEYQYNQHPVEIRTINLNQHWSRDKKRLSSIV
ncbi:MAG: 5-methylcytosine-specific restriction endonuclease system specificity protein McrC [Balneolaceae bacterium]|nr:5-methylcytosine-specific restriction endonuclease system specificity protein McrC [Balneolaceae bacterium]